MEGNQPSSSQEDDMIPLSKVRNRNSTDAGSSDEDISLADLRRTGFPISDFDDSDADPEYKPEKQKTWVYKKIVFIRKTRVMLLLKDRQSKRTMTCCRGHNREVNYKRKVKLNEKTAKMTRMSMPMMRTYKSEDEKEPGTLLNGKGTYENN
ncbi:hypothetical protein PoB_003623300 [Plakobranchus ocellatus]|uniref:Uncharacterized protein n=1 Tax=Plakobranchus ocellatus TaxID=259542 RepID=A0AAV4AQU9_9GAST|nr:hypothetical protein PoB_003623300 [Plakobranchus ocellatus]